MQLISYIITLMSIVGTVANAFQKRWCFYVWILTNLFWIIYDVWIGAYGQALLYVANCITCLIGLRKWKKKGDNDNKAHWIKKTYVDPETGEEESYTYFSIRQMLMK